MFNNCLTFSASIRVAHELIIQKQIRDSGDLWLNSAILEREQNRLGASKIGNYSVFGSRLGSS